MRSKRPAVEEPIINLTPLIDVVFVILIMFIVIAPLLELDKVNLAEAPKESAEGKTSLQEASPVSIHVRKDNSIWFSSRNVTGPELTALLKKARNEYPDVRPQLFHDKQAHFGTYQTIKNAAEEAGYHQLDIVLKPS